MTPDRPAPAVHRDLAWAMKQQAIRAGEGAPLIRGADWRLAVVTALNSDGTLAADGIPSIRRIETFTGAVLGETIVITQSSAGNWLALGRLAGAAGEWTALPLSAGFTAAAGYMAPTYRVVGREVQMRGSATKSSTLVSGDVWATLPAGARPPADMDIVMGMTHGTNGTNFGACRGIIRAATGGIEYRGPSVSTLVFLSPISFWL